MSGDASKKLNPNAHVFVPRVSAAEFVPGQPVQISAPIPSQPPPASVPIPEQKEPEPMKQLSNGVGTNAEAASKQTVSEKLPDDPAPPQEPPAKPAEEETWEEGAEGETETEEEEDDEVVKPKEAKKPPAPKEGPKKPHVNVVFIGHVDAGKSTIGGHIMKLTGMVDERTLAKYEREAKEKNRESWYLSWALDTNQEERDKGKTVEVGRAYFETEKKHFTILDAPGHKSFVPNMIGGASQADLGVLVISARRGEFETGFDRGGQTREHAMLAKTAGVKHLVILVNKMDEAQWAEERYLEIQNGLVPYLRKVGFNPKTDLFFIPCSGLSGAFLMEPAPELCPWYKGPCFIQYIDDLPPIKRRVDGPVRVKLTDKYSDMGTIVMGKVESGTIVKGQELVIMPNKTKVQVLQIWSDDEETSEIEAGESVKLKLKGVEESDILSGFVLCSPTDLCKVGRIFDAQVVITEAPSSSIITTGYTAVLHIHAAVEEATVKNLICLLDKKTQEKIKPGPGGLRFVKVDQACIMRLECPEVFCMDTFKDFPEMARLTLRDEGRTIAIGKVLKVVE